MKTAMTTEALKELRGKITQGEWQLIDTNRSFKRVYVGEDQVCKVDLALRKSREHWEPDIEQTNANAAAICLVPELLAKVIKLREALSALLEHEGEEETIESGIGTHQEPTPARLAAIAKAHAALASDKESSK